MRTLPLLLCLAPWLLAADEDRVRERIRDLAADDPVRRAESARELEELGDQDRTGLVERLLEEACRDADPEVRERSAGALKHIRWWDRLVFLENGPVDLESGQFLWRRGSWYLAGFDRRGRDSRAWFSASRKGLRCVDPRTAKELWAAATPGGAFLVGREYGLAFDGKTFSRISLEHGEVEWTSAFPFDNSGCGTGSERPEDTVADAALVGFGSVSTYGFDTRTGKPIWTRDSMWSESLALSGNGLYACTREVDEDSEESFLRRLDPSTGADLWTRPLPGSTYLSKIRGAGKDLVVVTSSDVSDPTWTAAFACEDGRERWTLPFHLDGYWLEPDRERIWVLAEGALRVISLQDGKAIDGLPFVEPEVSKFGTLATFLPEGERLYVAEYGEIDGNVRLQAFDVRTRERVWNAGIGEGNRTSTASYSVALERVGPHLVMYDNDFLEPLVLVLDPATGREVARHRPHVPDDPFGDE